MVLGRTYHARHLLAAVQLNVSSPIFTRDKVIGTVLRPGNVDPDFAVG